MGQTVDARTDIYSSGVMLYQLLTGEKPFEGGLTALMHKVLNTEPLPPSALSVTLPHAFDAVVARAMAKRPADRFATATEFSRALRDAFENTKPVPCRNKAYDDDATMMRSDATMVAPTRAAPPPVTPAATARRWRRHRCPQPRRPRKKAQTSCSSAAVRRLSLPGLALAPSGPETGGKSGDGQHNRDAGAGARDDAGRARRHPHQYAQCLPWHLPHRQRFQRRCQHRRHCRRRRAAGLLEPRHWPPCRPGVTATSSVQTIDGPYCDELNAIRPYHGSIRRRQHARLSLTGGTTLHNGALITVHNRLPFSGYLETDYFSSDGTVLHLTRRRRMR